MDRLVDESQKFHRMDLLNASVSFSHWWFMLLLEELDHYLKLLQRLN